MAHLTKRLLPTPEDSGSDPSHINFIMQLFVRKVCCYSNYILSGIDMKIYFVYIFKQPSLAKAKQSNAKHCLSM